MINARETTSHHSLVSKNIFFIVLISTIVAINVLSGEYGVSSITDGATYRALTHNDVKDLNGVISSTSNQLNKDIIHFVQYGVKRSASTFQFQTVCLSLFLHIKNLHNNSAASALLNQMYCGTLSHTRVKDVFKVGAPAVIKSHKEWFLGTPDKNSTAIFLSNRDKGQLQDTMAKWHESSYNFIYGQNFQVAVEKGYQMVEEYASLFNLTKADTAKLSQYIRLWDILRMCCGKQMSANWRNELLPPSKKDVDMTGHPSCGTYDIDAIEQEFTQSELFMELNEFPRLQPLNKPSTLDGDLFGTYCSSYNDLVRTEGVGFNEGLVQRPLAADPIS